MDVMVPSEFSPEDPISDLRKGQDRPFVGADSAGIVREINARFRTVYGWTEKDLIGQSLDLILPPSFRDSQMQASRGFRLPNCPRFSTIRCVLLFFVLMSMQLKASSTSSLRNMIMTASLLGPLCAHWMINHDLKLSGKIIIPSLLKALTALMLFDFLFENCAFNSMNDGVTTKIKSISFQSRIS